jgi:DNA mismatch endonuclease, patch repair protein
MAGIKSRNTKPERRIRSQLHRLGYRFSLHPRSVPGRPDVALRKYRVAIHVHGCFWHGHDCSLYHLPDTRSQFWAEKAQANQRRDRIVTNDTLRSGWRHLTVWECAMRGKDQLGFDETIARITRWVQGTRKKGVIRSKAKGTSRRS